MELLHPRCEYHRAYTEDAVNDDGIELSSIRTLRSAKSDYTIDSSFNNSKEGYSELSLTEYGNDYHRRGLGSDQIPLIAPTLRDRWTSGWRLGAYSAACIALMSLIINLAAAIWLKRHPNANSNLVQVYNGNCGEISKMDIWVHLLINAISTLLLGGSNYCMQCLCAPTRQEIDKVHAEGQYLDIGVPSYRNLSSIAWPRVIMWWLLGLSSIPLHLMYNSAFYSSLSSVDYDIYTVIPEFLTTRNATWNGRGTPDVAPSSIQSQIANDKNNTWKRLEPLECIQAYSQVFLANRRNLVLVTSNTSALPVSSNTTIVSYAYYDFGSSVANQAAVYRPFDWICTSDPKVKNKIQLPPDLPNGNPPPCDAYVKQIESIADRWSPYGQPIDYCLAESIEEQCSFNGNLPIVTTIIVANTIKAIIMLVVAYRLQGDPLITIGDAIESFLDVPEETTRGVCSLTRKQAALYALANPFRRLTTDTPRWSGVEKIDQKSEMKSLKQMRWSSAASGRRWTLTIGLIIGALFLVLGFFIPAVIAVRGNGVDIGSVGFGTIHASALITGWSISYIEDPSNQILAAIFIANLPQAILSFLYLNLNGLLTSMWAANEWSRFAKERKPLRVSTPKLGQRSTHFLQLPYKVATPLIIVSGLLHWLVSQSIFLAVVAEYSAVGDLVSAVSIATCGFSPLAQIMVLLLGTALIVVSVIIGRRKYDSSMPLAGSCSAAIAAACHRPDWDHRAGVSPVQWGVLPESIIKGEKAHCCFTSGEVTFIQEGQQYAGLGVDNDEGATWRWRRRTARKDHEAN